VGNAVTLLRDRQTVMWAGVVLFTLLCLLIADNVSWVDTWPVELVLPLVDLLNGLMAWFIEWFGWFFRGLGWLLGWPITATQWVLHGLPWPITIGLCTIVAHKAGGWRLAVFAAASMFYMLIVGYWDESMNTLALVAISVPLSIAVGFGFGVLAFRSPRARRIIMPSLDLLQTVPVFAYLIPILLLFGFGTVVGLVASLLYAFPPMVRNTVLGLERVPSEAIESGLMAGASERQLFWQVRVPSASRQILLGVNQTTMAALSMVIIASIIGGTADIGWEVLCHGHGPGQPRLRHAGCRPARRRAALRPASRPPDRGRHPCCSGGRACPDRALPGRLSQGLDLLPGQADERRDPLYRRRVQGRHQLHQAGQLFLCHAAAADRAGKYRAALDLGD
jgi:glycine betaine/proline transport system permease protein